MPTYAPDGTALGRLEHVDDADLLATMACSIAYDRMSGMDSPYFTTKFWYQNLLKWRPIR